MKNTTPLMIISFLMGIFLSIMPLPGLISWFRPQWIFLVLLFWILRTPETCGIGLAWLIGLLTDCLMGVSLGQHALVYVFLTYIVLKFHALIFNLPQWQQMSLVLCFSIINLLLQKIIFNTTGVTIVNEHNWLPAVLTTFCWPFVYRILNRFYPARLIY